ncbi:uncharacterized protein G2W53_018132 [Senna tora]|uniref:Uncharacterized protein n=1 Tax=Senna tora TaxID=362788 RepID=A0A834WN24_9FABA|nr:uncharacterized protein G2W53_018132 [Senna tora]
MAFEDMRPKHKRVVESGCHKGYEHEFGVIFDLP